MIIVRLEEDFLWECYYLGVYTPNVLLAALIFFNMKYFQMVSVHCSFFDKFVGKCWFLAIFTEPRRSERIEIRRNCADNTILTIQGPCVRAANRCGSWI